MWEVTLEFQPLPCTDDIGLIGHNGVVLSKTAKALLSDNDQLFDRS